MNSTSINIENINMDYESIMNQIGKNAKDAYLSLANCAEENKNNAILEAANIIAANKKKILEANKIDIENAHKKNLNNALIDRLALSEDRIDDICNMLISVSKLPDPVGKIIYNQKRPNGLNIIRKTIPLGVVGIIYESRPNVTADAWALCIKSGNAVILRPGSESFNSSNIILELLNQSLKKYNLPQNAAQILPSSDRILVDKMLQLDKYIDVIIPRGGKNLIKAITSKSKIPIFKHLDGNCHTYINNKADINMAIEVLYNAKLRRAGICGATESVLVDVDILDKFIPLIIEKLLPKCEIRADDKICKYSDQFKYATEEDYAQEYLDKILSIKSVKNIDEAISHINHFSSGHTDAIISDDKNMQEKFLNYVDSAIVMINTSTQFADGGEFGLGSEIGISTGRMHARGPVGLEQLVTYKYQIIGDGQIRP